MWDFIAGLFVAWFSIPGARRITVADRYAMKRRIRAMRKREKEKASASAPESRRND